MAVPELNLLTLPASAALTFAAAARLLGVSVWTIREWVRRGKLKPTADGQRIPGIELIRYGGEGIRDARIEAAYMTDAQWKRKCDADQKRLEARMKAERRGKM